jgi:TDG/mug DNA glycosylase family protein
LNDADLTSGNNEPKYVTGKPTPAQIRAAEGNIVPDVIAPGLKILFCGINPGLYSGAVGHHFARPGNRFWPALHAAGFTDRILAPHEERLLLKRGVGITNLVARATAGAKDLDTQELAHGSHHLQDKIQKYRPNYIAVLGIGAYRRAFNHKQVRIGKQAQDLAGARLWVLPNPSGLNAHYQLDDLARLYGELRVTAGIV